MKVKLKIAISFLLCSSLSYAEIINVPVDIDSIQGGINLANPGDTVLVQPGTYEESINFSGKNVVVGSLMLTKSDTSYISRTVIHGNITFEGGEDSTAFLCGFKVIRGSGRGFHIENSSPAVSYMLIIGEPVACINSNTHFSHVTIDSCVLIGRSSRVGGGVYCENSDLRLTDVKIMNSEGIDGGGMYCKNSNPTLINVKVKNNYASFSCCGVVAPNQGGGLYFSNSSPTLVNVIVSGNYSDVGGGIYCSNSNPSFSNVTITGNNAPRGGGICFDSSNVPIFDPINRCNIYFNRAAGYDYANDILYTGDSAMISIVVDTFTVKNPTDYDAYPVSNFIFDILNAKIEPVNSDLYVNPDGDDSNSGLFSDEPLRSISYALDKISADSLNSHTIYLANGIYSPSTTGEKYPINMRNYVSLYGESKSKVILDAESKSNVFRLLDDVDIIIKNLTITGGFSHNGGAIYCDNSDPIFSDLIISGNEGNHGCIFLYHSDPTFYNVTISNNNGVGVSCQNSSPSFFNMTICGNSGGGIYCNNGYGLFVNSILWNNTPNNISLGYEDTIYAFYSDIQGGWIGEGNIDIDPMFVNSDNGDYRLQEGSLCIDSGIQDTIIIYNDGQDTLFVPAMDFIGSAPDKGAYEFGDPSAIEQETIKLPKRCTLRQNYPNPFNPSTTFGFDLPKSTNVRIEVYNIAGQKIQTLLNEKMVAGSHQVEFIAQNLSSGVYFYRIGAGEFQDVKKMILLR